MNEVEFNRSTPLWSSAAISPVVQVVTFIIVVLALFVILPVPRVVMQYGEQDTILYPSIVRLMILGGIVVIAFELINTASWMSIRTNIRIFRFVANFKQILYSLTMAGVAIYLVDQCMMYSELSIKEYLTLQFGLDRYPLARLIGAAPIGFLIHIYSGMPTNYLLFRSDWKLCSKAAMAIELDWSNEQVLEQDESLEKQLNDFTKCSKIQPDTKNRETDGFV